MREKAEKGWTSAIVRDMRFDAYLNYRYYFPPRPKVTPGSAWVSSTSCAPGYQGWKMCVYDFGPQRTLCYISYHTSDTRCITDRVAATEE